MKATFALITLVFPALSFASSTWVGEGTVYTPSGAATGNYHIEVVNTDTAPNTIESRTTITPEKGPQKVIVQTIEVHGNSWTVKSSLGKGGGACYGGDVCENYIEAGQGLAMASTIIHDGELNQRSMTILLKDGQAQEIFKDKLSKVK